MTWLELLQISPYADAPLRGELILIAAVNPTPAGEDKTTTSVGLRDRAP